MNEHRIGPIPAIAAAVVIVAGLLAAEAPSSAPTRSRPLATTGDLNGAYHSYAETRAELRSLVSAFPDLAELRSLGTTLEGRDIEALRISGGGRRGEARPAFVVLGCHHAREWISVEVPLLFARRLLESYAGDTAIRSILDRAEVWVAPLVNPDGLEYSIRVYRMWRKNRRQSADNIFGVDVNRNYGFEWGYDEAGSSGDPASEVYRGPAPFSEAESDAVRRLVLGLDLRALVSYHSYSQTIMFPWGYADLPTGRDAELLALARRMAELIYAVNGRVYAYGRAATVLYPTNGDVTDWAFAVTGAPSFTIELPPVEFRKGGFLNAEADIDSLFRENWPALLYLAGVTAGSAPAGAASPGAPRADRRPIRLPEKLPSINH